MDWFIGLAEKMAWWDIVFAIGIVLVCLLFRKLFTRYIFTFLVRRFRKADQPSMWMEAFQKPLSAGFVLLGVYLALKYLLPLQWEHNLGLDRLFRSGGIMLAGWGIYNLSASSSSLLDSMSKRFGLDDTSMLIPFLSKALRFVIVLLVITIVGSEWGFSINGVVAGMGLGSLAIALAAKETLGNVFGGIVIILEKPFAKGDWILTPSVEGFVEDITFRSTQIRTFADSVVTVPNSILANQPITNWSKMGRRRITFTLKVALNSNPERLHIAVSRMEQMLVMNEQVHPATIMVRFNEFNDSSLGIFFYFFTKTTVWAEYLTIRQQINFDIMTILEEEGIQLAYPAQRIFVEEASESELPVRA